MPLRSIERSAVRAWAFRLAEDVSARRAQNAYALLRHLLDEAVAEEHLGRNPALRIRLPQAQRPEVVPWTFGELMAVADSAGRYRGLVTWLGLMGTRWAETVGLRPSDFDGNRVNISSSLSEVRGVFHRVPTKTYQSRTLPIPQRVMELLPEGINGLIFTSPRGFPLRSAQFRDRHFLPACQAAGVRPIRIHHMRHTAASLLAQRGVSPTTVQRWLGHQDIRMTMNTYTHAYMADLQTAALGLAPC
jgi:integrase